MPDRSSPGAYHSSIWEVGNEGLDTGLARSLEILNDACLVEPRGNGYEGVIGIAREIGFTCDIGGDVAKLRFLAVVAREVRDVEQTVGVVAPIDIFGGEGLYVVRDGVPEGVVGLDMSVISIKRLKDCYVLRTGRVVKWSSS